MASKWFRFLRFRRGFLFHAGPYTLRFSLDPYHWITYASIGEYGAHLEVGPLGWHYHSKRLPF